jgi:hypothetical protein
MGGGINAISASGCFCGTIFFSWLLYNMSDIHSVSFLAAGKWTADKSRAWLKQHDLKPIKRVHKVYVDGKLTQLRYRIRDPKHFKTFSTVKVKPYINIIIGYY